MKKINKEMIDMVKNLLKKSRDPEEFKRDKDIQAYLALTKDFNERG